MSNKTCPLDVNPTRKFLNLFSFIGKDHKAKKLYCGSCLVEYNSLEHIKGSKHKHCSVSPAGRYLEVLKTCRS